PQFIAQGRHERRDRVAPRLADDVANEEDAHYRATPSHARRTLVRIIGGSVAAIVREVVATERLLAHSQRHAACTNCPDSDGQYAPDPSRNGRVGDAAGSRVGTCDLLWVRAVRDA